MYLGAFFYLPEANKKTGLCGGSVPPLRGGTRCASPPIPCASKTKIIDPKKEYEVLTFGPVSVLPEYQGKGIGSKLIRHTKTLAQKMGHRAIIIYGDPAYYSRFGFTESKNYGIKDKNGNFPQALLALELHENALNGITGIFDEGKNYNVSEYELEEFEKRFSKKTKGIPKKPINP